jgi:hypothetical protein
MHLIATFLLNRYGRDLFAVSSTPNHAAYAVDVARRDGSSIEAIEQGKISVPGTPERADNRDWCYLIYRMSPVGGEFVRVQFHSGLPRIPGPFGEWAERRELNHIYGGLLHPTSESSGTREGIGAYPGSQWPGWNEQGRSVRPDWIDLRYK